MNAIIDPAVGELAEIVGIKAACEALGQPRATYYRHQRPTPAARPQRLRHQPRALSQAEQDQVLEVLHSDRFVDEAPATVVATLLDEEVYLASESTMYRLLRRRHGGVIERRRQATHPPLSRPELVALGPNDIWSWDITRLRGPRRREFYFLYVLLDIFSRYVPGWMLARSESGDLARRLAAETITKLDIDPARLTLHSDRGVPASKPVAQLLATLDVTRSVTRPRTPNDNPFSEAQFRTMKYRPEFPERFDSYDDARTFCGRFFSWYNLEHRHSGIGYHTPASVYWGTAEEVRARRATVLDAAYHTHPERFVAGPPTPPRLPEAVYINPPEEPTTTH